MMEHTEGEIEIASIKFYDNSNENAMALYPKDNHDRPICCLSPLNAVDEQDEANAKRIRDLWNAANGMPTDKAVAYLEHGAEMEAFIKQFHDADSMRTFADDGGCVRVSVRRFESADKLLTKLEVK